MYDALKDFAKDIGFLSFNKIIFMFENRTGEHICTCFLHFPSKRIKICQECDKEYPIDLRIEHQR